MLEPKEGDAGNPVTVCPGAPDDGLAGSPGLVCWYSSRSPDGEGENCLGAATELGTYVAQ